MRPLTGGLEGSRLKGTLRRCVKVKAKYDLVAPFCSPQVVTESLTPRRRLISVECVTATIHLAGDSLEHLTTQGLVRFTGMLYTSTSSCKGHVLLYPL